MGLKDLLREDEEEIKFNLAQVYVHVPSQEYTKVNSILTHSYIQFYTWILTHGEGEQITIKYSHIYILPNRPNLIDHNKKKKSYEYVHDSTKIFSSLNRI